MTINELTRFPPLSTSSVQARISIAVDQSPVAGHFSFSNTAHLTMALRSGDEEAFRWLHNTWNVRLFRYCFVVACADEVLAGEIAQATYIKVFRHIRELPDEEALWNWMARAARSAASDMRRTGGRYQSALARFRERFRLAGKPGEEAPATGYDKQLLEALDAVVKELPDEDRALLDSRYFEGIPLGAIAVSRATTERAIEGRLARLRRRLRELIQRELRAMELEK